MSGGSWPLWLLTYNPEDWPGACHPECAYWRAVIELACQQGEDDDPLPDLDAPPAYFHPELL